MKQIQVTKTTHSALCEKAVHKDCTCPCNGKYHGTKSPQSKLIDTDYDTEFTQIEEVILEELS
ncbi:MAG: hypothetical protein GKS07_10345 [Nitrosopumilus sp.]|nr:MAG: hypothetical protein GKS07_10345 [Nitrosopumilus sp.]